MFYRTGCYTLELAPLRPYTFPPIKPKMPRQKKAKKEMVKAKFKRANYTDVGQESPALSKWTVVKQVGPSVAAQGASKQVSFHTEKAAEASLAAKKAEKRVANPSTEVAKKVSDKETEKKRPTEVAVERSKKKQRVEESTQKTASIEAAATGFEEEPATYDLSFTFKSKDHIASILQACTELCSKIPCSTDHEFPEPDDLIEAEAYLLFTGSVMEVSSFNLIVCFKILAFIISLLIDLLLTDDHTWESDHRKIRALVLRASKEARGLSERGGNKTASERRRGRAREEKDEKESLRSFHDQETFRLRSSRRYEVTQIIAKCDAKILRFKKSISDNEEANRLSALMNQAMAIKDYLAGFKKAEADVCGDRFKELDVNFNRFEKDFDALDVEEVTDGDFKMTPPPWMSSNLP
ncbi:unnamed protein product [Arabis nemorensis]|uniref:DUF1204 domain-containing protein n=1 Tax=Arabis nemorensis TaxID=586526 RepID=A0A565ASU2_9BRAS|nr:unnamed protein product [Arabis nemorensis]